MVLVVELVEAGTLSTCLGLACVANASSGAGGGTGKGQASTKKVSADEVFKQLASVPRDKVAGAVKKLV